MNPCLVRELQQCKYKTDRLMGENNNDILQPVAYQHTIRTLQEISSKGINELGRIG